MRYATVAAVIALSLIAGPSARADSVLPEDAEPGSFWLMEVEPGNSWKVTININNNTAAPYINHVQYRIVPLGTVLVGGVPTEQRFVDPPAFSGGNTAGAFHESGRTPDNQTLWAHGPPVWGNFVWTRLELEVGSVTGLVVPRTYAGVPPFVLQMEAWGGAGTPNPVLRGAGEFYFNGTNWQVGGTTWNGAPAAAYAPGQSGGGVSAWNTTGPIPEPVTMAGMLIGVGGLVRYVRRRRAA